MERIPQIASELRTSEELGRIILGMGVRVDGALVGRLSGLQKRLVEQEALIEYLSNEVITDKLTGVKNRHALESEIMTSAKRIYRSGDLSFGIALVDLNNFKSLNDTYGHQMGDEALKAVAKFLKSKVRSSDEIYRYGGDEFVVYFDSIRPSNFQRSKRYSEFARGFSVELGVVAGKNIVINGSTGLSIATKEQIKQIATKPDQIANHTINDLIKNADESMYLQKNIQRRVEATEVA